MLIYYYIFLFFFITLFSIDAKNKYLTEVVLCLTLISYAVLPFLVGFNTSTADYHNYLKAFNESPTQFTESFSTYFRNQKFEIGYVCLQILLKKIFDSPTAFFCALCFLSFCFRYKFVEEFVSDFDYGIVLFAFFSHEFLRKDCVQIRNGIASAIVLYSLSKLYKGHKWQFVFIVLLASSFQLTALGALPLILIKSLKDKKKIKTLEILFLITFLVSVFLSVRKIIQYLSFFGVVPPRVNMYLNIPEYSKTMSFFNPFLIKQIVICLYFFHYKKMLILENKKIAFLFQVYLVSTMYYLIFRDFEILAGRFGSLFYAVEAPLLVNAIEIDNKSVSKKRICLIIYYFVLYLYNVLTFNALGYKANFF